MDLYLLGNNYVSNSINSIKFIILNKETLHFFGTKTIENNKISIFYFRYIYRPSLLNIILQG